MNNRTTTFPLRLPASLKAAVEKIAAMDGTSANQFSGMAAAEKLSAIQTAEVLFSERRGNVNAKTAIRFLTRVGCEKPRVDDELS